jgi:hypothetical protein
MKNPPILYGICYTVAKPLVSETAFGFRVKRMEGIEVRGLGMAELNGVFLKELRIIATHIWIKAWYSLNYGIFLAATCAPQERLGNLGRITSGARRRRSFAQYGLRVGGAINSATASPVSGRGFTLENCQFQRKSPAFRARQQVHQSIFHAIAAPLPGGPNVTTSPPGFKKTAGFLVCFRTLSDGI